MVIFMVILGVFIGAALFVGFTMAIPFLLLLLADYFVFAFVVGKLFEKNIACRGFAVILSTVLLISTAFAGVGTGMALYAYSGLDSFAGVRTIIARDISDDAFLYEIKLHVYSDKIKIMKVALDSAGKREDASFTGWAKSLLGGNNITKCTYTGKNRGIIREGKTKIIPCFYDLAISGGQYDGKTLRFGVMYNKIPLKADEIWKLDVVDDVRFEDMGGNWHDVYVQFR